MTKPDRPIQQLLYLDIDDLMPDPGQPRKTFLADEIARLAASIAARGMLAPLRVRRDEQRQKWLIITGESRWRAARLTDLVCLPCLPVEGQIDESDLLADQITENVVRHALLPMELARSLAKLKRLNGYNSQQLATELGLTGSAVTRAEALLSLPPDIQQMVDDGRLVPAAAYELSRLNDEASQRDLANAAVQGRLSRDDIASRVRSRVGQRQVPPKSRFTRKIEGGITVTVTAGQPLTAEQLLKVVDAIRREIKRLQDGKETAAAAAAVPVG